MKIISFVILGALIFFLGVQYGSNQNLPRRLDMTQVWEGEVGDLIAEQKPWMKNALYYKFGGLELLRPLDDETKQFMIYSQKPKGIFMIGPEDISFSSSDGRKGIIISDTNNDGVFDVISYDLINDKGQSSGFVIDSGRDGEPDKKVIFGDPSQVFVRIGEKWLLVERSEGKSFVEINGFKREVRNENGRHSIVPEGVE